MTVAPRHGREVKALREEGSIPSGYQVLLRDTIEDHEGEEGTYNTIVFPLKLRSLSGSFLIT